MSKGPSNTRSCPGVLTCPHDSDPLFPETRVTNVRIDLVWKLFTTRRKRQEGEPDAEDDIHSEEQIIDWHCGRAEVGLARGGNHP